MAIDYIIEYECLPKERLTPEGILERIKEKQRAETVIQWFREAGDERPPSEMGFEFSRSARDEPASTQLIVVQDLLDHAAALDEHAHHCSDCPANRSASPFGCMGFIQYPINAQTEAWLLDRLPVPDEPLIWLLLKQGIQRLGYDGSSVRALRERDSQREAGERAYFLASEAPQRRLGELRVTGDQALEMIIGVGERIIANHAGILLLFFDAIDRDLEASEIQGISSFDREIRERFQFEMAAVPASHEGIREMISFFHALYLAWKLDVSLFVDA